MEHELISQAEEQSSIYRLAGFWVRLWAFLIDVIIISILNLWLIKPLVALLDLPDLLAYWLQMSLVSFGIIGYLYFILMTRLWAQSLGKMIMGIKVIRTDGRALDLPTVIFRELVGRTISQAFGLHLGYLWVMFSKRKQAWHDQLGDTYVVYEEGLTQKQFIRIPLHELRVTHD